MGRLASALLLLLLATTASAAGSICGTVRDAQSLQGVPRAAVFLFDHLDQYTGRYAATDQAGHYCIDDVADGTYTLQVRVDDHLAATVQVVVNEGTTGVDITARPPYFLARPWPNPASSTVVFQIGAPEGTPVTVEVLDAAGRLVMGWKGAGSPRGRDITWDLRDLNGGPVAPGSYRVRLKAGGREIARQLVRLR